MAGELTSSTEESSEDDDTQPLLLRVPQFGVADRALWSHLLPKTMYAFGWDAAAPRVQVLLGLCYIAEWAKQLGRSADWSRGDESRGGPEERQSECHKGTIFVEPQARGRAEF